MRGGGLLEGRRIEEGGREVAFCSFLQIVCFVCLSKENRKLPGADEFESFECQAMVE